MPFQGGPAQIRFDNGRSRLYVLLGITTNRSIGGMVRVKYCSLVNVEIFLHFENMMIAVIHLYV